MQSKKRDMKTYSILIKGTGPCGTGEKNSSADLLTLALAQNLKEAGHQVTHASIVTEDDTLLLHGELSVHPEPPEEKKGGGSVKRKGAGASSKPADKPTGTAALPSSEGSEEGQGSETGGGLPGSGAEPGITTNPETNLAGGPA